MKFSVLMSVYKGDDPMYLDVALDSILVEQTLLPDQVVIVVDGAIPRELSQRITSWERDYDAVDVISIDENVGLSNAMNVGLGYCRNEIIFRMDADDVSNIRRFEKQIAVFAESPGVSMIGGNYRQFDETMSTELGDRELPVSYEDIVDFGRFRTPINHVTIGFRKCDAISVGGYPDTRLPFEDWWFALRFIKNNKQIVNVKDSLVDVRSGSAFYERRSGLSYVRAEVAAMFLMNKEGLMSRRDAIKNLVIRTPVRLLPPRMVSWFYEVILRK